MAHGDLPTGRCLLGGFTFDMVAAVVMIYLIVGPYHDLHPNYNPVTAGDKEFFIVAGITFCFFAVLVSSYVLVCKFIEVLRGPRVTQQRVPRIKYVVRDPPAPKSMRQQFEPPPDYETAMPNSAQNVLPGVIPNSHHDVIDMDPTPLIPAESSTSNWDASGIDYGACGQSDRIK
ncbi:hypothetical protein B566_EDAN007273 [Ephemera danica]|nr:hypothetical protein B566_EDAN007273 [Ephemera danica]